MSMMISCYRWVCKPLWVVMWTPIDWRRGCTVRQPLRRVTLLPMLPLPLIWEQINPIAVLIDPTVLVTPLTVMQKARVRPVAVRVIGTDITVIAVIPAVLAATVAEMRLMCLRISIFAMHLDVSLNRMVHDLSCHSMIHYLLTTPLPLRIPK